MYGHNNWAENLKVKAPLKYWMQRKAQFYCNTLLHPTCSDHTNRGKCNALHVCFPLKCEFLFLKKFIN